MNPACDYFPPTVASSGSGGSGGRTIGLGLVTFVGFGGSSEEAAGFALRDVGLSSNVGSGGTGRLLTDVSGSGAGLSSVADESSGVGLGGVALVPMGFSRGITDGGRLLLA